MNISDINNQTLEMITDAIRIELVKRGFHAPIWLKREENVAGRQRLEIVSEPFQTTPVLFKSIEITSSGGGIKETNATTSPQFVIGVKVGYQHFGGGSNGCDLFSFQCYLHPDGEIGHPMSF